MDLLAVAGANRNSALGYIVSLSAVGLSFLLRLTAGDYLSGFPYILFLPCVLGAAFFGGIGPGVLAALLSVVIVEYVMSGESWHLLPVTPTEWLGAILFLMNAALVIVVVEALLSASRRANETDMKLLEFNAGLDRLVDERTERLSLDMAEQTAAQVQMREAQKLDAIAQLTSGLAHDFNNMLAVIVGSLDLAERRLGRGQTDQTAQCIRNARDGAARAASLTQRLLAFSRQQLLAPEPVNLNTLLPELPKLMDSALDSGIRLKMELPGNLWTVCSDVSQLRSSLVHLATNACEAMPDGGVLTIEAGNAELDERYVRNNPEVRQGQYVMISITDTGNGMAPDVLQRAFDPFYTTKGPGNGTGLGLSQVFGFVKQSGGHIRLQSEVGKGTSVKLYLPRQTGKDAAPVIAPLTANPLPRAVRNEIVLVVEDEDNVRQMAVEALRELGYSVIEASSGRDALQQISAHSHIDLLFTDVVMPEMNGKMVADAVKDRFPGIKVVYTTGYTRNAIVHNGVAEPGINLLPKPFTLEQLAVKISEAMRRG